MRHSKKKFVNEIEVDFSLNELNENYNITNNSNEISYEKYDQAFMQFEDNKIVQGFLYLHNDNPIVIPEPDPSILYFTSAEMHLLELLKHQKEIFESIGFKNSENVANLFFSFFQLSSNFVINLFASMEAFNNSLIPTDFTYREKRRQYNRNEIQRFIKFETKIKTIIPEISNKSFFCDFENKYNVIDNMKQLSDNVIHTKNYSESFAPSYRELFRDFLSFNYQSAYNCTKDYMNYYKENWIEDCNCNKK